MYLLDTDHLVALTKGMTVLTRNTTDFRRVPGVKAEDWTV